MTGTCRPKYSPGIFTQANWTASRNVHTKIQIKDLWLRVEFCTCFSFIKKKRRMYRIQLVNASVSAGWYCKFYNTIRQRQRRPQPVQKTPVVLNLHVPIPGSRNTSTKVHKGWGFPRRIYSEIHSPIRTLEIICIMALTLQPITGCPQHSGKTGTQLLSAIHRCLFFWFFLREGGLQYTGYSVHASCFLVISLMSTPQ